ncbi:uncharacterized protein LOC143024010 [Oratosquilla oratoria]|uniref:uncharacterized protein LOC143024010 n=1 Tax=Oratosquilla oratoria TaxID=337810 RepID=UPI003F7572A0
MSRRKQAKPRALKREEWEAEDGEGDEDNAGLEDDSRNNSSSASSSSSSSSSSASSSSVSMAASTAAQSSPAKASSTAVVHRSSTASVTNTTTTVSTTPSSSAGTGTSPSEAPKATPLLNGLATPQPRPSALPKHCNGSQGGHVALKGEDEDEDDPRILEKTRRGTSSSAGGGIQARPLSELAGLRRPREC